MQVKQIVGYTLLLTAIINLALFMFTVTTPTTFWIVTLLLAAPTFTMYRQGAE